MQKRLWKKSLAVAVILLFIGVAFAPSIHANISKPSLEKVEFTAEVCGLNGGKQTVQLTKAEAVEVEALFKSIREQLNNTETREEAEEIFKEAVVELDKYGLLGGLSVEQAQRLATGRCRNPLLIRLLDKIGARWKENSGKELINSFCLVFANIKDDIFNCEFNVFSLWVMFGPIISYRLACLLWLYSQFKPFRVINVVAMVNLGVKFSVYSLGLLRFKNTIVKSNDIYMVIYFTGIIIKRNCEIWYDFPICCDTFYFGSAFTTELYDL
ncbi:MAG: hypothetical protein ACOC80_09275 [Petrotogales bacterium]